MDRQNSLAVVESTQIKYEATKASVMHQLKLTLDELTSAIASVETSASANNIPNSDTTGRGKKALVLLVETHKLLSEQFKLLSSISWDTRNFKA